MNKVLKPSKSNCALKTLVALAAACVFCMVFAAGCSSSGSSNTAKVEVHENAAFTNVSDKSADSGAQQVSDEQKAPEPEASGAVANSAALDQAIRGLVGGYGDSVSVAVSDLGGSSLVSINADKKFVSASMIKLLILAEFCNQVDAGKVNLDAQWVSNSADVVGGTGKIYNDPIGTAYSYDTLARYMIMYSDNTATNVLINTLGKDAINQRAATLGLGCTQLNRKMMDLNSGVENYISANDAVRLLQGFANKTIASAGMCQKAEGYLKDQTDKAGLAAGVPGGIPFGNKTGSLNSIRHDGGIVYAGSPFVVVVLTEIGAGSANQLMSNVASACVRELA